jgi:hypothetical protein
VARGPVGVRFRRLFDLSLHRLSTIADMHELRWGEVGGAWLWRRPLRAWEEEQLVECREFAS